MTMAVFTVLLMTLGATGYGALTLRVLRLTGRFRFSEDLAFAAVIGQGVLGWLAFVWLWRGWVDLSHLIVLSMLGVPWLVLLKTEMQRIAPWTGWEKLLLALIALAIGLDLLEALSPPVDADTMAYHFDLPRRFIEAGGLYFVPVAVAGLGPLGPQGVYAVAFGIGGELAMTLWTLTTGWIAVFLVFIAARRFIERPWALAVALSFATLPAVIYGAGSGQVEVRLAAFTLLSALMLADYLKGHSGPGAVILAGLCAGFYVAGKYLGLVFAAAAGAVLLAVSRRITAAVLFSLAVLAAGFQWYAWSYVHTGDPVFPMLWGLVPYTEGLWSDVHAQALHARFFANEHVLDATPWNALLFPFQATLAPDPVFEGGRVGFGPLLWLLSPFVVLSAWNHRRALLRSRLTVLGAIVLTAYLLWFFLGSPQRLRHLLPLYPIALIVATGFAWHCRMAKRSFVLGATLAVTLALQLAVHGLFTLKHAQRFLDDQDRITFLENNVPGYPVARWLNENVAPTAHVMAPLRQLQYLIDAEVSYATAHFRADMNLIETTQPLSHLWEALQDRNVTHIVVSGSIERLRTVEQPYDIFDVALPVFVDRGCAQRLTTLSYTTQGSRTLPGLVFADHNTDILALTPGPCPGLEP